ncbi:hypothetical protein [Flexivirga sp. B27]
MAKQVFVSSAQRAAAEAMVNRSAITGRKVSKSVRKIAEAKIEPSGNASRRRVSSGSTSA